MIIVSPKKIQDHGLTLLRIFNSFADFDHSIERRLEAQFISARDDRVLGELSQSAFVNNSPIVEALSSNVTSAAPVDQLKYTHNFSQ